MFRKYEVEQYAPYSMEDLSDANAALMGLVSATVIENAGKTIARQQRFRTMFVPFALRAEAGSTVLGEPVERYLRIRGNVIEPTRPFAFSLSLTEIFRSEILGSTIRAGGIVSSTGIETVNRYGVKFEHTNLYPVEEQNANTVIPEDDVLLYVDALQNLLGTNKNLSLETNNLVSKRFRVIKPFANGSFLNEAQLFANMDSPPLHQATFKDVLTYAREQSNV